jgi:hypothetical protein
MVMLNRPSASELTRSLLPLRTTVAKGMAVFALSLILPLTVMDWAFEEMLKNSRRVAINILMTGGLEIGCENRKNYTNHKKYFKDPRAKFPFPGYSGFFVSLN